MIDLGIVKPGKTIRIPFNTFDSNDPSASVTITGFAVADIKIYKDGSTTERASTAGYTATTDFDAVTGVHFVVIDLADNTTAGFFAAGSEYIVVVDSITVDAATVSFVAGRFVIGYPEAVLNTTIATLSTQTSFTLTDGPAEDDALNGCEVVIHDVASQVQVGRAIISDYTGATKTVTLAAATTFTIAATDNIAVLGLAPLQATTVGNTLDVTATGAAGIDWGNIENKTTANDLSGTDIQLCDTVTTLTGHTAQTGDTYALANGAAGFVAIDTVVDAIKAVTDLLPDAGALTSIATASALTTVDTVVDAIKAKTDSLTFTVANQVDCNVIQIESVDATDQIFSPFATYGLDHLISAAVVGTDVADNSIIAKLVSSSATADWDDFVNTTDSLQALRDHVGDGTNLTEAGGTGDHLTTLATAAALTTVDTVVDGIQTDLDNGTDGLGALKTLIDAVQTTSNAIETDTQDIQGRLPAALVSGKMDSDMTSISGSSTAADNLEASALGITSGACEGTPTTTVIQTDLAETTDDHYIGRVVVFTSGAAAGQATDITDYTGSTGTITVTALTTAPSASDTFVIV